MRLIRGSDRYVLPAIKTAMEAMEVPQIRRPELRRRSGPRANEIPAGAAPWTDL